MSRILILGETTFDIIFKDNKPTDAKVGGSQLNTCVSLGRLGLPVKFISSFGRDKVGAIADEFLQENNIGTEYIHRFEGNSRIALAFLDEKNNAHYSFYHTSLDKVTLSWPQPTGGDFVLFGSSFALNLQIRDQLLPFLHAARQAGATILYDPNFRPAMLSRMDTLRPLFEENMALAHVVKGSDEDFGQLFGGDITDHWQKAAQKLGCQTLIVTANSRGVWVSTPQTSLHLSVPAIAPVSTIGAGDTFNAGIIFGLYHLRATPDTLIKLTAAQWEKIATTATEMAQHVCMHYDNYLSPGFAGQYSLQV